MLRVAEAAPELFERQRARLVAHVAKRPLEIFDQRALVMLGVSMRSSSSRALAPPSASSHASISPVGPEPTTTTSAVATTRILAAQSGSPYSSNQ